MSPSCKKKLNHLKVERLAWEREDRWKEEETQDVLPGTIPNQEPYGGTDDIVLADEEGVTYEPPENPPGLRHTVRLKYSPDAALPTESFLGQKAQVAATAACWTKPNSGRLNPISATTAPLFPLISEAPE